MPIPIATMYIVRRLTPWNRARVHDEHLLQAEHGQLTGRQDFVNEMWQGGWCAMA
jgi:hypothetical protein